jgi:hypothetical protein
MAYHKCYILKPEPGECKSDIERLFFKHYAVLAYQVRAYCFLLHPFNSFRRSCLYESITENIGTSMEWYYCADDDTGIPLFKVSAALPFGWVWPNYRDHRGEY